MAEHYHSIADCGYACISTLLEKYGHPISVAHVKEIVGSTDRGLTIKQVAAAFRQLGARGSAIAFDREIPSAFPCPGVALLSTGHYIVLSKRAGDVFEIFDPLVGWQSARYNNLALEKTALGVTVDEVVPTYSAQRELRFPFWRIAQKQLRSKLGIKLLCLATFADLATDNSMVSPDFN